MRWSYGLDFDNMRFEIVEPLWNSTVDADIKLYLPFYDVRSEVHVDPSAGERIGNQTLNS
jgi:hypothetical protein